MLSAWLFAVYEGCSGTCSSCQSKPLCAVRREMNCIKGIYHFLSLMFHIRGMKTGWESDAMTTVVFLHFVNISEKRCSFLSRMWLSVVAEVVGCCWQQGQTIPFAFFVSVLLSPYSGKPHYSCTTETKPTKSKLNEEWLRISCHFSEEQMA